MPVKVQQKTRKIVAKLAKICQNRPKYAKILRLSTQVVSSSLLKRFFNKENMIKMMSNSYFCLSTNVVYKSCLDIRKCFQQELHFVPSDLSKIVNLSGVLQLSAFQYQSRLSQENKSWICSSFNFALQ